MPFVTKLDYSDNRQIKQFQQTNTQLSGATEFGILFSGLTGGVNTSTIVATGTLTGITSTFSGNTTTTDIVFGDSRMISGAVSLYAITNVTSGDTQQGYGFLGVGPYQIDGNTLYTGYTGSSYDLIVTTIEEVGVNEWTGETLSPVVTFYSGSSSDFTERTIWVDVHGITQTKRLILVDELDFRTGDTITVLGRASNGDVIGVEISGVTGSIGSDDFTTGGTFNNTNGNIEFVRQSGGTYDVNIDGRYLPISAYTATETDDFTTGATFNLNDGVLTFSRISGATYDVNIDGRFLPVSGNTDDYLVNASFDINTGFLDLDMKSGDTVTVDMGGRFVTFDNLITGVTVTGGITKTITLTNKSGGTISDTWTDLTGGGGSGDVVTGMTFDTGTGILELRTLSGDTITEDLDGRYLPLSAHTDDYTTGATFNSSDGIITFNRLSGGTYDVNIGAYSGSTSTDNDDYTTGATFNTGNGIITFTRLSGGTYDVDLDGRYLQLSGATGLSDDYTVSASYTGVTGSGSTLEFTRLSGGTYDVNLGFEFLDTISGFTFGSPDDKIIITGDLEFQASDTPGFEYTFPDKSGTVALLDDINFLTGATFSASTGDLNLNMLTGNTITVNIDDRYLQISAFTAYTGSTTGTDDYTTGATFNSSTGIIEFTRQSGGTYNVNISAYSGGTGGSSGDDYTISATYTGVTGSGATIQFLRLSGGTYDVLFDYEFNPVLSGWTFGTPDDTLTVLGDLQLEASAIPGFEYTFPDISGEVALVRDINYLTGTTFDTSNGVLSLGMFTGNTFNVDLDGRYLQTSAYTDNHVTGFTYTPTGNTLTIERNNGLPDLDITITEFSGLTITNSLSATTIYSGDTNLIDVFVVDTRVNNVILNGDYVWISGYTYEFWADLYYINGVKYDTYTSAIITLGPSDPVLDRFDLVVINDTGVIEALSGTPATYPSPPISDSDTQVDFVAILVEANTSQPSGVFDVLVYDENTQIIGGEWDTSIVGGNVILSATSDSYSGVTSILFTGATVNDGVTFDSDTTLNGYDVSSLYFRVKLLNAVAHKFTVQLLNVTGSTGTIVTIQNGVYGLDTSLLNVWQLIVIPIADLGVSAINYNQLKLVNKRNSADFYVDRIILQNGLPVYNQTIITRTSQLINDGEDGVNPFITALDLTDDFTTGATFNTSTGVLEFTRQSGTTYNVDLDGRYLTGFTETPNTDDYLTGHTFNTGTGLFESTLQSGGTVSVNLDGRYLEESIFNIYTGSTVDNDDFTTGATFNTNNGVVTFTRISGGTYDVDLDGRYAQGNGLANQVTYWDPTDTITGDTSFIYNPDTFLLTLGVSGSTLTNGKIRLYGSDSFNNGPSIQFYVNSAWQPTAGFSNYTIETFREDFTIIYDKNAIDLLTFDGELDNWRIPRMGVGTYTTGYTEAYVVGVDSSGYLMEIELSSLGDANTDDYTTGATFNTSNGILEFTRQSGSTYNVDLDGRYVQGSGLANQVTYWDPTDTITGDTSFRVIPIQGSATSLEVGVSGVTSGWLYLYGHSAFNNAATLRMYTSSSFAPTIFSYDITAYREDFRFTYDNATNIMTYDGLNQNWRFDQYGVGAYTGNTLAFLLGVDSSGNIYEFDGSNLGSGDDFTTGATFNSSTGIIEFTRQSGATYSVDISAYSGGTGGPSTDDYTISAIYTGITGSGATIDFTRLSGGTYSVLFDYEFDPVLSGWTFGTPDDKLTVLGDLQFEASAIPGFEYTFPDKTGTVALLDDINFLTGSTFSASTGDLNFDMLTGNTITVNLDGRYLLESIFNSYTGSTTGTDDYTTGATFNTSTGVLEFTRISGGTYNVDIGAYSADTNVYVSGGTFNSGNGLLTYTNTTGGTFNVDISAYSGETPNLQEVTDVGSTTTNQITAANFVSTSGGTGGSQNFLANSPNSNASAVMAVGGGIEFGYLSLRHQDNNRIQTINMKSNPTVSGTSIYSLPDRTGSYTLPIVFSDGSTTVSADTTGLVNLTPLGLGENTDDYTTGATFNSSTGIIEFTRQSGATYNVDISAYSGGTGGTDDYITGGTFDTSTGDLDLTRQSGGTVTINLDDRYQPIHIDVTQASHGFDIGDAVGFNGSAWFLALADSPANAGVIGLVSKSADTNNFSVQTSGVFTGSTWTSGTNYFLSNSVSGSVVTEPTYMYNEVRQYIGTALSTSELLLSIDLGDEVTEFLDNYTENLSVVSPHNIDWYYETHRLTLTGNTTLTDSNLPTSGVYSKAITLYVDGNFTLTLPTAWQTYVTGTYDGATLNQIVVEYIKSGLYWVDINRAD